MESSSSLPIERAPIEQAQVEQERNEGLSELESKVLDFERHWWRYAGAKESSIKELFNISAPQYYQLLNNLIDRPEALLAAPMLVKRLRRLRESRTGARKPPIFQATPF